MDITRSFIETAVAKALRDIQRDPDRSIRNIVDLGQNFTKGKSGRSFLHAVQSLLENEHSAYYDAVKHIAASVDHKTIKTFGMNMGYNGLTKGVKQIRALKQAHGFAMPWCLSLHCTAPDQPLGVEAMDGILRDGKGLGIFTYLLYMEAACVQSALALCRAHQDCAFLLFMGDARLSDGEIAELATLHQAMLVIPAANEAFFETAAKMQASKCLYAAYAEYDQYTLETMTSPVWMESLLPANASFLFMKPREGCPKQARQAMRAYCIQVREGQRYPVFMVDLPGDMQAIGKKVSGRGTLDIGPDGEAVAGQASGNILGHTLWELLGQTMPQV